MTRRPRSWRAISMRIMNWSSSGALITFETLAHLLSQLPGEPAQPVRFEIEGRLGLGLKAILARQLATRVVDEADRSCIVYRRRDLGAPLRFPDPAAIHMLRRAADRELAAMGRADLRSLVEHVIAKDGTLRGRREVSAELGISERSLDRLLAQEGVRFSELVGLQRMSCRSSDPAEETFPYFGRVEFVEPEGAGRITAGRAEAWRADYAARIRRHRAEIRAETDRLGWSFIIHRTDRPPSDFCSLHARIGASPRRVRRHRGPARAAGWCV